MRGAIIVFLAVVVMGCGSGGAPQKETEDLTTEQVLVLNIGAGYGKNLSIGDALPAENRNYLDFLSAATWTTLGNEFVTIFCAR